MASRQDARYVVIVPAQGLCNTDRLHLRSVIESGDRAVIDAFATGVQDGGDYFCFDRRTESVLHASPAMARVLEHEQANPRSIATSWRNLKNVRQLLEERKFCFRLTVGEEVCELYPTISAIFPLDSRGFNESFDVVLSARGAGAKKTIYGSDIWTSGNHRKKPPTADLYLSLKSARSHRIEPTRQFRRWIASIKAAIDSVCVPADGGRCDAVRVCHSRTIAKKCAGFFPDSRIGKKSLPDTLEACLAGGDRAGARRLAGRIARALPQYMEGKRVADWLGFKAEGEPLADALAGCFTRAIDALEQYSVRPVFARESLPGLTDYRFTRADGSTHFLAAVNPEHLRLVGAVRVDDYATGATVWELPVTKKGRRPARQATAGLPRPGRACIG